MLGGGALGKILFPKFLRTKLEEEGSKENLGRPNNDTRMLRANFSFPKAMSYSLAILLEKAMFSMKVRENLHVFVPYLHRFARSCTR